MKKSQLIKLNSNYLNHAEKSHIYLQSFQALILKSNYRNFINRKKSSCIVCKDY